MTGGNWSMSEAAHPLTGAQIASFNRASRCAAWSSLEPSQSRDRRSNAWAPLMANWVSSGPLLTGTPQAPRLSLVATGRPETPSRMVHIDTWARFTHEVIIS